MSGNSLMNPEAQIGTRRIHDCINLWLPLSSNIKLKFLIVNNYNNPQLIMIPTEPVTHRITECHIIKYAWSSFNYTHYSHFLQKFSYYFMISFFMSLTYIHTRSPFLYTILCVSITRSTVECSREHSVIPSY